MNPSDPASFNHRTEKLSTGHTYHFIDQKPENFSAETTPTLLLVHGFPDFWYGWRYQIGPWARKGWRVVAPDMIGYGGTDKPSDLRPYASKSICNDLAALLDCIGVSKAIVVGHDWGAHIVWRFCQWHPQRVRAVIAYSIPYSPPSPEYIDPVDIVKSYPDFGYQLYFGDEKSTKQIEDNLLTFFNLLYRRRLSITKEGEMERLLTGELPLSTNLLNAQEMQYYLDTFKGAMRGPLAYYKVGKIRFEDERDGNLPSRLPATLPALFVHPTSDPTCNLQTLERSKQLIPSLHIVTIERASHWVMIESKEKSVEAVIQWVDSL